MRVYTKLKTLFFLSAVMVAWSCSSDLTTDEQGSGTVLTKAFFNGTGAPEFDESDSWKGVIKNASDEKVAEFSGTESGEVVLPAGKYSVEYTNGLNVTPAWDTPYYYGEKDFTVTSGQVSDLSITVSQKSFGIKLTYSDKFKETYGEYSAEVTSPEGTLAYAKSETRSGHFFNGPVTVKVNFTTGSKNDSYTQTIEKGDNLIAPGSMLTVKLTVPNEGDGGGELEPYYKSAKGKVGADLKSTLTDIIEGHRDRGYSALWEIYRTSDRRSDGTVWDIYSDNPNGANPYDYSFGSGQCGNYGGEGDCYNREHTVPKSWFGKKAPMVNDFFHILPTDGYVNGKRSSHPYGEVDNASWTSQNGSELGSARSGLGYSGTAFEPIDEYKGDVARIYFYFVTRYASKIGGWDNEVFSHDYKGLDPWALEMFLKWHKNDPVSQKEITRNEEGFKFQGNRNPYVDHPEFVDKIWVTSSTARMASLPSAKVKFNYILVK
ncbi:hypothetical protein FUAX_09390 [Fulvitalea axinellae]|uniref:Endonuclease I n=1 Tax=Fulvitalea axinellae TaxID=1182444 RepID=A0AAU9CNJ4_9BACT|nr:hypothetical protein FUAX_09390 [Fulvitalea axinellae]